MRSELSRGGYDFRRVTMADLPMLAEWMSRPHWREWWGEPDQELGFVRDMIEGRDPDGTQPLIFAKNGFPIGYIQVWRAGPHQAPERIDEHPWLATLPADALGIDVSIGDESNLAQGHGSGALRALASALRNQGYTTIVIDPDPENARAVRAYEKAGFAPLGEFDDEEGRVLLMKWTGTLTA